MFHIEKRQCTESGMILTILVIVIGVFTGRSFFFSTAIVVLIVNLLTPIVFKPFAVLWFGMSHYLGKASSFVMLSLVYWLVLFPVSFILRTGGRDSLSLKKFKTTNRSAFTDSDHVFVKDDIVNPY